MRVRFYRRRRRGRPRWTHLALGILCAGVLGYCLSGLIGYGASARQSAAQQQALAALYYAEATPQAEKAAASGVLRQYQVSFQAPQEAPQATAAAAQAAVTGWPGNPQRTVSAAFQRLQRQNRDIVAWLNIPGVLDQAVVQRDNSYYLRRDYLGYHNDNGALFLEEHISLTSRPDTYIVFGHNMKSGQMFGSLRLYENAAYFRQHALLSFNVLYEEGQYVVFAVASVDIMQGMAHFAPFMQLPGLTGEARLACIRQLQALSKISAPVAVDANDQLLLLVTCDGGEGERRVVAARRLRENETADGLGALLQRATVR